MSISKMSAKGEAVLVTEEGEVLRAYRCPAGVWTIGLGLTAGSGVIAPRAGMTITQAQSRELAHRAIDRNYGPRVKRAGLDRSQHEFDGSLLFDWNTGRIHNASWVPHYLASQLQQAAASFKTWTKGGGKVLPGLVRRRNVEWDIIEHGRYPGPAAKGAPAPSASSARDDVRVYQAELEKLGYDVGPIDGISGARTLAAVRAFQDDHDLTVDGIVGPATRAAIKRALDIKAQGNATATGGAGGGAAGAGIDTLTTGEASIDTLLWALGLGICLALLVAIAFTIWRYRGPLFAWLPEGVKDFFEDRGVIIGRRVRT